MSRANTMRGAVADGRAPRREPAAGRSHAFHKAARHSRRVRLLRWALPTTALGGLALLVAITWFDPLRFYRNLPIEFGRISITDNKLTIEAPKLTGFTQDSRPYWVTAEEAAQDLGEPSRIELAGITGQVDLANRGETRLRASKGLYDMKAGVMRLSNGIEIDATGGYRMELNNALMQVRQGRIVTDQPVKAIFPDGTLEAKRLEILEHGDHVKFSGGIVMTLRVQQDDNPEATGTVEARR